MTKQLPLHFDLGVVKYASQPVARIVVDRDGIVDWCLVLSLIRERLIDSALLVDIRTNKKLRVQLGSAERRTIAAPSQNGDRLDLVLAPTDLDYVLHGFLKYYRDGVAEVDHFDVQADFGTNSGADGYVTFVAPDAAPPVTEEEARRRLGIR